jgi:thiamine kinase-like enzyme
MVGSLLSDLDSLIGEAVSPDFIRNTNNALAALEIPSLVCEHRDLGPQNIYIDSDNNLGVIDWEYSRLCGIPALDLIFFLTRASMIVQGAPKSITISESYQEMIDCNTFTGTIFYNCLNSYMDRLYISKSQIPALRLMTWIVHYCWRMFYDKLSSEHPLDKEALNHWSFTLWTEELSISGN